MFRAGDEYEMDVFTVQAAELDLRASTLRDRIAELERALARTQSAADEVERALALKSAQLEASFFLNSTDCCITV